MRVSDSNCSPRLLDALAHKVHQHLGMDFSGERRSDLLRRLLRLAQDQQPTDTDRWLEELAFADWNKSQIQALVPLFSVGETYFRRDAQAFDWLAQHHLKPLLERRRKEGQRSLRLWSAACCTGEEAYGLLFLVDELLGFERDSWQVDLLATDINEDFLVRARHGLYGRNAFRGNDEAYRSRYFQAEGSRWRVRTAWRDRIRFVRFNLADSRQPSPMPDADLILCRNVLMYFSPARAGAALRRLLASLEPNGVLMLSSVEAGIATRAGLKGRMAASNYALTKQGSMGLSEGSAPQPDTSPIPPSWLAAANPAPGLSPQSVPASKAVTSPATAPRIQLRPAEASPAAETGPAALWDKAQQALANGRPEAARQVLHAYLDCPALSPAQQRQACLLLARSWADEHQIELARQNLERALTLDAASASAYWLLALLEQQVGNNRGALSALQKALYLEPDFVLGYFLQARLLQSEGQTKASSKSLQVCRQLLGEQAEDAPVPRADGMSCAQLLRLCEQISMGDQL
ncbi:CheR family methyltransferase [Pseudomonas sp. Q2-TVG4-2]|uniref:CheR family methyltransferase n=1 Tax=Pseudomonas sp. Q2-TVG4-2 TaxID=1685699 RepID=UPI0015E63E86|nr:CheR family methyltransferase [Pseudomonas sp. Q2-TVG4-2]